MDLEQIKEYWDERASKDASAQSTTQDFYLREIEYKVLKNAIESFKPQCILDIGCGDCRTTSKLALNFKDINFFGCDYSEAMINNAKNYIAVEGLKNLSVVLGDVTSSLPKGLFDLVYTTRCLINIPSKKLQRRSIKNIVKVLKNGGLYIMIENFVDSQKNFNAIRKIFDLPEIPIREHNLFFEKKELLNITNKYFDLLSEQNITSTYYLVSRIIYSKLCQDRGIVPDYFDEHHKYAARLPFAGEYGPTRMLTFKKR